MRRTYGETNQRAKHDIYILIIISVISTRIHHTDCYRTEDQSCKPGMCHNGDCFLTPDSITIGSERDGYHTKCPYGFDHHKGHCFRIDHAKKNWSVAHDCDIDSDQLAKFSLVDNSYRYIAAEYLKSKLSDDPSSVWINLILEDVSVLLYKTKPCCALEPANYTYWEIHGCKTTHYSLRTTSLVSLTNSTSNIMCRCRPGYTGRWCNITETQLHTQEMTNPDVLQCPTNKFIYVEFAVHGYTASVLIGKDCFAPNILQLLRYLCQGKNKCKLGQLFRIMYILPFCKNPDATLAVRYSCVDASELSCSSDATKIEDEKTINCLRTMHQNVSWGAAMDFCLENGGQLAAYNSDVHINAVPHISKFNTFFWIFDELPEIRPDPREPEECSMAIIDNTKPNISSFQAVRNCSKKLPGICAIPPFHQESIAEEEFVQPTEALMANTSNIMVLYVHIILAFIIYLAELQTLVSTF